jgi:PHP family Zn ribbon phosphoesterase
MADEQNTTYHIESAASGRAKCKKCKEPIAKGELRIATSEWKAAFAGFPANWPAAP